MRIITYLSALICIIYVAGASEPPSENAPLPVSLSADIMSVINGLNTTPIRTKTGANGLALNSAQSKALKELLAKLDPVKLKELKDLLAKAKSKDDQRANLLLILQQPHHKQLLELLNPMLDNERAKETT